MLAILLGLLSCKVELSQQIVFFYSNAKRDTVIQAVVTDSSQMDKLGGLIGRMFADPMSKDSSNQNRVDSLAATIWQYSKKIPFYRRVKIKRL